MERILLDGMFADTVASCGIIMVAPFAMMLDVTPWSFALLCSTIS